MTSATDHILLINVRRRRAEQLTGMVFQAIERYIDDSERAREFNIRRRVFEELGTLFSAIGVEVVTDFSRVEAGLPLRNEEGYTVDELRKMEQARLEAMTFRPTIMVHK